jgi:hypothetical protein
MSVPAEPADSYVLPPREDPVLQRVMQYLRHHHLALLALFVALGGTSYAAVNLPARSVGSKQLKKNAVSSSKVKNGSLQAADLSSTARAALKGQQGATGAAGSTGARGPAGPTASAAVSQATSASLSTTDADVMHADIKTSFNSTLVANATADVVRNAGASGNLHCRLQMAAGPSFATYSNVGQQALSYESGTATYETVLPVVGATTQPPGTYRFRTICATGSGSGSFIDGGITVIATAH